MDQNRPEDARTSGASWQRRSLYAFSSLLVASNMLGTAVLGAWATHSLNHTAASLTGLREWLSLAFAVCAAALVPFMIVQARPGVQPRWAIVLLCTGCFCAALLWVGTAFVARHADLTWLRVLYLWLGGLAVVLMLLVAANCNAALRAQHGLEDVHSTWRESNRVPLE